MNVENEIAWMRKFKAASSLSPEQFDALLEKQRALWTRLAPELRRDKYSGGHSSPGYQECHDCGALIANGEGCPLCETVNRSKLPPMAFGIEFASQEEFDAWKKSAL